MDFTEIGDEEAVRELTEAIVDAGYLRYDDKQRTQDAEKFRRHLAKRGYVLVRKSDASMTQDD